MSITLTAGTTTINLPDDLQWIDEDWSPVRQTLSRGITGAAIVQSRSISTAGRPITLRPPDESSAWMTRPVLEQLRNLAAINGQVMTLTIAGQTYSVRFRYQDNKAIESEPVVFYNQPDNTDRFLVTINLMTA